MKKPKFITLEGIDGAGKSTHLAWLENCLRARGVPVMITREPGGTPLGERLREILLNHPMEAETETLLMFAARKEHIAKVILPALQRGKWVISDRFSDASFAYQGGGRGVPAERLEILERWVHQELQPDLTLFFDVPVEIARQRLASNKSFDRFEKEQAEFFQRVREAYLRRAQQFPQRFRVINANRPREVVKKELEDTITSYCL